MLNCVVEEQRICSLSVKENQKYIPKKVAELRALGHAGKLRCEICNQSLRLRAGSIRIPHFYHYRSKAICEYEAEFKGESSIHKLAKEVLRTALLAWHPDAAVEVEFRIGGRRADVYADNGIDRLAIEYQNSRLSIVEWEQREAEYRSLSIKSIWLFGMHTPISIETSHLSSNIDKPNSIRFDPESRMFHIFWEYRGEALNKNVPISAARIELDGSFNFDWSQERRNVDQSLDRKVQKIQYEDRQQDQIISNRNVPKQSRLDFGERNNFLKPESFPDRSPDQERRAAAGLYLCKFCQQELPSREMVAEDRASMSGTCRECLRNGKTGTDTLF